MYKKLDVKHVGNVVKLMVEESVKKVWGDGRQMAIVPVEKMAPELVWRKGEGGKVRLKNKTAM
jgi:hypothetical protein